jgi:hypothetical protein
MTPIAVASPAQKSATPAFALASFVAKPMASPGTHPCGAPAPASLNAASRRGTSPYGAAQEDDRRGLNLRRSLDPMMARLPCGISLQRDQRHPRAYQFRATAATSVASRGWPTVSSHTASPFVAANAGDSDPNESSNSYLY